MPRDPDDIIEADYQEQIEKKKQLDESNDPSISELFVGEPTRKQYDKIPELTYETLDEQYENADYVLFTVYTPVSCGPHYNRGKHVERMHDGFTVTYSDWVENDYEIYQAPGHIYGKFTPDTVTDPEFPAFEALLEQYIESWGIASISFSFERGIIGRSNALIYDRRDTKPPYPGSKRGQKHFDSKQEKMELLAAWESYERSDTDQPRYEYRPLYEVNGDHGLKGMDVTRWASDELGVNLRMNLSSAHVDVGTADPGRAGPYPDARLRTPSQNDVENINPDYKKHLTVTEPSLDYSPPNSTDSFPQ